MATRKRYTPGEDSALLAFVEANKHRSPIRGNKLWRLAEAQKVTPHTWQSMKARYELITGEKKKKGQKREKKKREAEAQKRRLGFDPSTSTSTSTSTSASTTTSTYTTTSTSTSTSASLLMPTPSTTRPPPPPRHRQPRTVDDTIQTDGTGMVSVGVGIHLFCPVSHYRPVDVSTQTQRPSLQRSQSF